MCKCKINFLRKYLSTPIFMSVTCFTSVQLCFSFDKYKNFSRSKSKLLSLSIDEYEIFGVLFWLHFQNNVIYFALQTTERESERDTFLIHAINKWHAWSQIINEENCNFFFYFPTQFGNNKNQKVLFSRWNKRQKIGLTDFWHKTIINKLNFQLKLFLTVLSSNTWHK